MKFKLSSLVILPILIISFSLNAQNSYWTLTNENEQTDKQIAYQELDQKGYQTYLLNMNMLKSELEKVSIASRSSKVIAFPNQYGELEKFSVVETQLLSPELATKYPNIKTYIGYGVDTPGARIRFSISPQGVQTMTSYVDKQTVFTVPMNKGNVTRYITYDQSARGKISRDFKCLTEDVAVPNSNRSFTESRANDQTLRRFRIAISSTAQYTNFWDDGDNTNGDAQADALAQVVSTLNRVNEVFEVDMAITFQLVSDETILFTNPTTDPYSSSFNFGSELQSTLDTTVGNANYDLGHLFHFGGNDGSANCIGCVCEAGRKGRAYSTHRFTDNDGGPYMSDFFDIDFVAHEIGHQMGANHTWSFASEGTGVNFEPGSGSTIMGYAGIRGDDDVQDHSDPYFHYASIEQILENVTTNPNTCWVGTSLTNNPPIANAGSDYTIPAGTPFVLRGAAADPDATDVLTYTWEQIDDGVTDSNNFGPTKTSGAIFRSRPPSTNPNRYMPIMSRILSGDLTETDPLETVDNTSWETVTTVSREMNFALTVRDMNAASIVAPGAYPQTNSDVMRVTVDDTAGPFVVTSQNTADVVWEKCSTQNISWDVAGTDSGNVNTQTVNVRLSVDGGLTYPILLAENVDNDGSHNIIVPDVGSLREEDARIMVEGNGNIFFAVNEVNFTILNSSGGSGACSFESLQLYPNPSEGTFILNFDVDNSDVTVTLFDLKGSLIKTMNYSGVQSRFSERVVLENISRGLYIINVSDGMNSASKKILIE